MFVLADTGMDGKAKIKVVGIGGGGGNAVNTMISYNLKGVDFIVANTDAQALGMSGANIKIQLGADITKGLGAGGNPELGKRAAVESRDVLKRHLEGADMIFITAGEGGGTGTGGAPVVAEIAKEVGALTIAIVTKPFNFEGTKRNNQAEAGISELRKIVDTLIVIPNQRLLALVGRDISVSDSFKMIDNVLYNAVKGISDILIVPGLINLDFADVKSVMAEMGLALMGTGSASGEQRAVEAAQKAISSPLLEDNSIQGARGILLNITGGPNMSLYEINEAASIIRGEAHEEANIIFGTAVDPSLGDEIRITVIATGFDNTREKRNVIPQVAAIGNFRRNDLTIPTFMRQERLAGGKVIEMEYPDEENYKDLDSPAFLRVQAD